MTNIFDLPYFPEPINETNFGKTSPTPTGYYPYSADSNIPIHLYNIEDMVTFTEHSSIISRSLECLPIIFKKIPTYWQTEPTDLNDLYQYYKRKFKLTYADFIEKINPVNIQIYYHSNDCSIYLMFNYEIDYTRVSITIDTCNLENINIIKSHSSWGGFSIEKSAMITYPPEQLYDFDLIEYEYIDNLNFAFNPHDCLNNADDYLNIAEKLFLKAGWDGDGVINLLWIPPFMLKDELGELVYAGYAKKNNWGTHGIILWHVKQCSDGISFLLVPKTLSNQLNFEFSNYRTPIVIDEIGLIKGRDAIYLDNIEIDRRTLCLTGKFNGTLCENLTNNHNISYKLRFNNVVDFSMTEFDFYDEIAYVSSFEKIRNSQKMIDYKKIKDAKLTDNHQHYVFHTYDEVFEVIAESFEIELGNE